MIKYWPFMGVVAICSSALAQNTCSNIGGQQSFSPLSIRNGTVCFVQKPVVDYKNRVLIGVDVIFLYYISGGNAPVKVEGRGLLYDDTPGKIIDAFSADVGVDHREKIFVIHSMEVRESLVEKNSSGIFYSVSVFDSAGGTLHRDDRSSDWFGADYSWISDGMRVIYKFPYQSREDVQRAINSPFALLMRADESIQVRVKGKSYLFDGPNVKEKTRKYLIKGDRATVDKVTAGWCQINHAGGTKPLDMWLMCNELDAGVQAKKIDQ
ncbi:hypothetical protein [Paraburkholderia sp. J12]|uniref:hypothetical protein n=1 Tax=Paraburkholderia sp. J12 TaxID=2805432 RepID=UPI002ABD9B9F|nr:hypothetical protein [Paraburkholderia sp. J12]